VLHLDPAAHRAATDGLGYLAIVAVIYGLVTVTLGLQALGRRMRRHAAAEPPPARPAPVAPILDIRIYDAKRDRTHTQHGLMPGDQRHQEDR
jgi:hypothetical protein